MEPLESGHRDPEGDAANIRSSIAKDVTLLGYELKNEQEESDVIHPVLWLVKGRAIARLPLKLFRDIYKLQRHI